MHHRYVDANQVATLRALLAPTGWLERTRAFARGLRTSTRTQGGLLLVGTPTDEPWHLTAHLDEESRLADIPELMPTLVRWQVPDGAPAHLRVGLDRLEAAQRGETLFVVTPSTAPVPLLERVNDARHAGATIFALDQGDPELDALAHESIAIMPGRDAVLVRRGPAPDQLGRRRGRRADTGRRRVRRGQRGRRPVQDGPPGRGHRLPAVPAWCPGPAGPGGPAARRGERPSVLTPTVSGPALTPASRIRRRG